MSRADEARQKLKKMVEMSESVEDYKDIFKTALHDDKEDVAIEYLLSITYSMLTSHGEIFNEVLESVGKEKADELKAWITNSRSRL